MITHELKIAPLYFKEVVTGNKTFEVRRNDRDYQVGDTLKLKEYDDGEYTGQAISAEVAYILDDPKYCKESYVIIGIKVLKDNILTVEDIKESVKTAQKALFSMLENPKNKNMGHSQLEYFQGKLVAYNEITTLIDGQKH